jgi:hypothetical protein
VSVMRVILQLPGQHREVICDVIAGASADGVGLLAFAPREDVTVEAGETMTWELNTKDVR